MSLSGSNSKVTLLGDWASSSSRLEKSVSAEAARGGRALKPEHLPVRAGLHVNPRAPATPGGSGARLAWTGCSGIRSQPAWLLFAAARPSGYVVSWRAVGRTLAGRRPQSIRGSRQRRSKSRRPQPLTAPVGRRCHRARRSTLAPRTTRPSSGCVGQRQQPPGRPAYRSYARAPPPRACQDRPRREYRERSRLGGTRATRRRPPRPELRDRGWALEQRWHALHPGATV
jgi:hypothetical protein